MSIQHFEWGRIEWVMDSQKLKTPYPMNIGLLTLDVSQQQRKHIHYGEEQILYIVQGEGLQIIEGEEILCKKGDLLYIEAGSAHETRNTSDEPLIELVISVPSGKVVPSSFVQRIEALLSSFEGIHVDSIDPAVCEKYEASIAQLRFPLNVFDVNDKPIIVTGPYPEICMEKCKIHEDIRNCYMYSDEHRFTMAQKDPFAAVVCKYGLTVFVYPLEVRGKMIALLQGGHIRTIDSVGNPELESMDRVHSGRIKAMLEQIQIIGKNLINDTITNKLVHELDASHASLRQSLDSQNHLEAMIRESEDRLYSVQLNNHFLFNTLNSLAAMAVKEDAFDTYQGIIDLANLFRYNLRSVEKNVRVQEELEFLENYMKLQKLRFGEQVAYFVHADEGALQCLIPFNTLQPLVENSFKHGFKCRNASMHIHVEIRMEGSDLRLSVSDDGCGIATSYTKDTLGYIYQETVPKNHGLFMINKRLQAHYGDEYAFHIGPQRCHGKEKGTCVEVKMPLIMG